MLGPPVAGDDIPPSQLRRVWRECVGGWFIRVFESPVYAEFFEAVRSVRLARRWNARGSRTLWYSGLTTLLGRIRHIFG